MKLKTKNDIEFEISSEDYDKIKDRQCHYSKCTGYIFLSIKGKNTPLHRFLMNAQKGQIIDHINNERLDNKRENLRFVTKSLNNYNRKNKKSDSIFGIYFDKYGNRFRPCLSLNNKNLKLGSFKKIDDAILAYNKKAIEIYKNNAILLKPQSSFYFEMGEQ